MLNKWLGAAGLGGLMAIMFYGCAESPQSYHTAKNKPLAPVIFYDPSRPADGVLVKFKSNTPLSSRARSLTAAGLQETIAFDTGRLVPGLVKANSAPGVTIEQTLQSLATDTSIAYAEPDYILDAQTIPNDSRFSEQYGLNNTGQTGGTNNADVDAPEAWDLQQGTDIIIAVIDTGVDYNHPELSANIWSNDAEVNGRPRVDDDGNGYVDDIRGWNFVANNNNPMDDNDHGSHVSGIIAAKGNNGAGVAGLNWNARIMPLKFMDATGSGATSAAIRAIEYAVNNGARISNNSWGGGTFSQALFDAIQAANRAGHLFVTAAGNSSANNDSTASYPANFDLANVISVAATDSNDRLATFSNFGARSVDLAAPGVGILSTVRNRNFRALSGTSMATPFVTGVAALVLAQNSSLPVADMRAALLNNVDAMASLNGRVATGGRLNAFKAVSSVQTVAPTPRVVVTPGNTTVPTGLTQAFTAGGGTGPYTWTSTNANVGTISASGVFTASATGSTQVTATDSNALASDPVTVTVTAMAIAPGNVNQIVIGQSKSFSVLGGVAPYQWTVSNSTVAGLTVSSTNTSSATVNATLEGVFDLMVSDSRGTTATLSQIRVIPLPVIPLALTPATTSMIVGDTVQLTVAGGTSPYSFSSGNSATATVDSTGNVTAMAQGSATITVTDAAGASKSATVTVNDPVNLSLAVSPSSVVLNRNFGVRLRVSGGTPAFLWTSSNPAIATVTTFGFVVPVAQGTTVIMVTDASGNVGESTVTVNAAPTATPPTRGTDDD